MRDKLRVVLELIFTRSSPNQQGAIERHFLRRPRWPGRLTVQTAMKLSIIVPAFNEAARLPSTLPLLLAYIAESSEGAELILVDDGSSDDSVGVMRSFQRQHREQPIVVIENPVNRGKGHAVRCGMLAARGKQRLFSDADLSTPLSEARRLLAELSRSDIVIGSRAVPGTQLLTPQSLYRRWGGKAINLFVRALVLPGIGDTQCGFKIFTRQAAIDIFSRATLDGFSFDVEVLYLARKLGYRISELAVSWRNAPGSKVHPLADGLRLLRDLLIIRRNDRRGVYDQAATKATAVRDSGDVFRSLS